MTDKTDIAALREAALKATPGNWKLGIGSTYAYVQAAIDMKLGGRSWVKLCHLGRAGWRYQQSTIDDARFIALANPATIIALLDQLEAERQRANDRAKENYGNKCNVDNCMETIASLEAEIAALKGDQVPVVVVNNGVTAENLRVIKMLLDVCGTAFELADDSCQQDVDGELCHVVPDSAFSRLSEALGEIESTLADEYEDLPNIVLQWAAIPRHALRSIFAAPQRPVITDEMALAFHFATTDGAAADDDVEDIKIGLRAALGATETAIKPKFGAPGSRDVEVRAARDAIDKAIEKLSNL